MPAGADGDDRRATEDAIGPYELQDFNLYLHHALRLPRRRRSPSSRGTRGATRSAGAWPPRLSRAAKRRAYDLADDQADGCGVFLFRFFQISQFKRSAMPNGPKVGSGGSLSPRGDWRAPSQFFRCGVAQGFGQRAVSWRLRGRVSKKNEADSDLLQ